MSEIKTSGSARELDLQIERNRIEFEGKYVTNEQNMGKFVKVYNFFRWLADENGGEVIDYDVHPKSIQAKVSIDVPLIDIHKDGMKRFIDILQYVDVFKVAAAEQDNLMIHASVNNVWEIAE